MQLSEIGMGLVWHQCTRLRCIWADGTYAGFLELWVTLLRRYRQVRLGIAKRCDALQGFVALPKRWIVERTFGLRLPMHTCGIELAEYLNDNRIFDSRHRRSKPGLLE